jgi:hypothetical protein
MRSAQRSLRGNVRVGGPSRTDPRASRRTPTSTIEVPVSVKVADPAIHGDAVVVMIVGTRPTTYFLATTPFGDVERGAIVRAAREQLHISAA